MGKTKALGSSEHKGNQTQCRTSSKKGRNAQNAGQRSH
ncbi:YuzL-like protein [Bacillus manliponensis]